MRSSRSFPLIALLVVLLLLISSGCGKKTDSSLAQNVKTLIRGYQQSMVAFFDIKNMKDESLLITQVDDQLKKLGESKTKLAQLSGLLQNVEDETLRNELKLFVDLGKKRESLALKYLEDIRRDLDYRYNNSEAQVDINQYIAGIPRDLLDLEYRSEETRQRIENLLAR